MQDKYGSYALYKYGNVYKYVHLKNDARLIPRSEYIEPDYEDDFVSVDLDAEKKRFRSNVIRARSTVFELALCNDFEWFCTFTFSEKFDRYDLPSLVKSFTMFIRNYNRGRPDDDKIKYILVPEIHPTSGAWHLHGLLKGLKEGVDLVRNEHGYLDWFAYRYRFGWFSCDKIRSKVACSRYVSKYMTKHYKDDKAVLESCKHLFYASQGLKRRELVEFFEVEPDLPFVSDLEFENEFMQIKWCFRLGDF